jgi:hypothetical protein
MIRTLITMVFVAALVGCGPQSGVVTGTSGPQAGGLAPDVYFTSLDGKRGDFNKERYRVAVVVFTSPAGADCSQLDPRVVSVVNKLSDLPVTIAQFAQPTGQCPHGEGCVEVGNLRKKGLMSFCDAKGLVWNAYGRPASGSLILIGPDRKIRLAGSLGDAQAVIAEARRLGEIEKTKRNVEGSDEFLY